MAEYGALKTLFVMLRDSLSFTGNRVSLAFGEENKIAQEYPTPFVCIVPVNGAYDKDQVGYAKHEYDAETQTYADDASDLDMQWPLHQQIELWCWAYDETPGALAIDHANATENLRAYVLQAFWDQRPGGLYFEPVGERWALMQDAENRYGRALVITISADVTVKYVAPVEATVTEVTFSPITLEPAA